MSIWCTSRAAFEELTEVLSRFRKSIETPLLAERKIAAYCKACMAVNEMQVTLGEPPDHWRNLLEGMVCAGCGLNGRMRLVLGIVDEIRLSKQPNCVLIFERVTPFYHILEKRVPRLLGCEFLGVDLKPGEHRSVNGQLVRHEDITKCSFESESFDLIIHCDVIEHVPDYKKAFAECYRILKQGGSMVFTCPFYHNLEKDIVRAVVHEGQIEHLLPAAYHDNPLSDRGSLVFFHPSWEMVANIPAAGFRDTQLIIDFNPAEGIVSNGCPYPDGHMWPVAFVGRKEC